MNFKAAIFDLDGTLLDSMQVWKKIDIAFLAKRGLAVTENYVNEICARSFEEAAEYTIQLFNLPESVEEIVAEWNTMAAHEYAHNVSLMPYTHDYILKLKAAGIKIAAATGLPEKLYKPTLIQNGVYELFDFTCSVDDVDHGKQHSDIYFYAAKQLGVEPQHCIAFEDVLPAVQSAKRAGMITYGVYDQYSAHHEEQIRDIADGYLYSFEHAPLPEGVK